MLEVWWHLLLVMGQHVNFPGIQHFMAMSTMGSKPRCSGSPEGFEVQLEAETTNTCQKLRQLSPKHVWQCNLQRAT